MGAGKRIRQMHRYRKITSILARNGIGFVSQKMGWEEKFLFHKNADPKSTGRRIRLLLEELGTTFIKLGQIASTRPDLFSADILNELKELQDMVPPFTYDEAVRILEEELGSSVTELFQHFSEEPLAAASIGQVHRAVLKDGSDVVVKIQRPNIHSLIETDLEIIADLARLAERRMEWAKRYRLLDIIEELSRGLLLELDYRIEARNMEKFKQFNKTLGYVSIPAVYWDYSTKKILTMDYIEGIKLTDHTKLADAGIDRSILAERLAYIIFHQILNVGHYHADPHPGNLLALSDGRIALLDFGMVGQISPYTKKYLASFIIALRNKSTKGIIRAISDLGMIPEDVDIKKLTADVEAMREKYYDIPLQEVSMGQAINDLFHMAHRHKIGIPTELTLVGKSLMTMEGVVADLDPDFSVFDVAEPFGKKLILDRFNPWKMMKTWLEDVPDYIDLLKEAPLSIKQFSSLMRKGKIEVEVTSPQLEGLVKKMDRMSNQMSFSIVLLALSIVMVGLIIGVALSGVQTVLWKLPIIEIGFVIAMLMFLWLIYSIFRSGRF